MLSAVLTFEFADDNFRYVIIKQATYMIIWTEKELIEHIKLLKDEENIREAMKKYNITKEEYFQICDDLKDTLYVGGETGDATVTGTINNTETNLLAGNIENLEPGKSNSVPLDF